MVYSVRCGRIAFDNLFAAIEHNKQTGVTNLQNSVLSNARATSLKWPQIIYIKRNLCLVFIGPQEN